MFSESISSNTGMPVHHGLGSPLAGNTRKIRVLVEKTPREAPTPRPIRVVVEKPCTEEPMARLVRVNVACVPVR